MLKIQKPDGGRVHEITAVIDYRRPLKGALGASCDEFEFGDTSNLPKLLLPEKRIGRWKCRLLLVGFDEEVPPAHTLVEQWAIQQKVDGGDVRMCLHMAEKAPEFNQGVNRYCASVTLPQLFTFRLAAYPEVLHSCWTGYVGPECIGTKFMAWGRSDEKQYPESRDAWFLFVDPTECVQVSNDFQLTSGMI